MEWMAGASGTFPTFPISRIRRGRRRDPIRTVRESFWKDAGQSCHRSRALSPSKKHVPWPAISIRSFRVVSRRDPTSVKVAPGIRPRAARPRVNRHHNHLSHLLLRPRQAPLAPSLADDSSVRLWSRAHDKQAPLPLRARKNGDGTLAVPSPLPSLRLHSQTLRSSKTGQAELADMLSLGERNGLHGSIPDAGVLL